MNLDELQSVQSRERQATSLQNLRASFYQDAGEFIQQLTRERDRAAERADDPFSAPEVRRLSDDIQTAKQTVEAIYERRVGKVVKMASIAAADMPTDDEGLTDEEAELFDTLVARIKENRDHVLDGVLEGEGSDLSCARDVGATEPAADATTDAPDTGTPSAAPESAAAELGLDPSPDDAGAETGAGAGTETETEAESAPVNAADMMGTGGADQTPDPVAAAEATTGTPPEQAEGDRTEVPPETPPEALGGRTGGDDGDDGEASEPSGSSVERTTVHVLQDVGEIFGVDERTYELSSDEVVTLPAANAEPLVEREAARRLE
jgi:DNA replication factor GINS